ncbi:type II secretion system F family protein [Streptomyces drozdowiczii]|uniref:Type II secretion system F family protein n=1 Tax=Streptomyces drozdowiczii TaxID=202862 RepID=A0ABY6PV24_9ACTN|nr:type II secretion system F family protein [Streptomyces drozdowiczii]MCX0244630.1 type II secretion system F family protein [Streptomyces drozdowiczii]UZK55626.1 type II secretion system F family protein [Streptomyces drozdowiczii]
MSASAGGNAQAAEAIAVAVCLYARVVLPLARRQAGRRVRRRGERLLAVGPAVSGVRMGPLRSSRPRVGHTVSLGPLRQWVVLSAVVLTGWFLVGGLAGWVVGLATACAARRWQRTRLGYASRLAAETKARMAEAARQLPMAADLLAACLSAGAGPVEAAEAVGESLGGPVGDQLARTAAEIRLGGDPAVAWGRFGEIPGAAALAGCLDRAGSSGAPAAEPVARIAEALRTERARAAVARAQRAGVMVTAPVGLCFLPAFLSVGVAPVVIGLAGGLLQPA